VTQWSRPRRVLSEIMRGSQVPLRDAVPADSPGHGHTVIFGGKWQGIVRRYLAGWPDARLGPGQG
jgi:hypothetical protein